jgi:anthranilate phosphoribosyltransferase
MSAVEGVSGSYDLVKTLARNFERAKEILSDGSAKQKLLEWIEVSSK